MARRWIGVSAWALALASPFAGADEGLWPLDRPLPKALAERHGFTPTAAWLEHLQKSCVRFNTGGSGSFVSKDGLVVTNHHVGSDEIEKASTPERDLVASGFVAKTREEEIRCPDLELRTLWSTEDVTARVAAAAAAASTPAEAEAARRRTMTTIEQEAGQKTGLHCQVGAYYQGARFVLHRYRRYDDVRLVMAPEQSVAFFGGDHDNFEYPRHDLDVCFFRVYEDGKPLQVEHHLAWSPSGIQDGDLALVCGHPGDTQRLYTVEHLRFLRDVEVPAGLRRGWRRESQLRAFSNRGDESARIAAGDLFGVENSRKLRTGLLAGLLDPALFAKKAAAETRLRAAVDADPEKKAKWGDGWDRVARAISTYRGFCVRHDALGEPADTLRSSLYRVATHLVRLGDEGVKPSPDRLREYRESEMESLLTEVLSPAPIYDDLEVERLASGLSSLAESFGAEDPTVAKALAGLPPRARAEALVRGSTLRSVAARKALVDGGKAAVAASKDPLVRLASDLDPEARALRKRYEDDVEGPLREGYERIAAARFAVEGDEAYPDGTFTLRLAFGPVRGYRENGRDVAPFTTFSDLYRRMEERRGERPFSLPKRWVDGKASLDLATPLNFVCTADIIGGNSGSPVVDRAGEVVGLVFDSNLQGLVHDVVYTDEQARCVCVDVRAVVASLRSLYGADALADEVLAR